MTLSNVLINDMLINMYVKFECTSASMSFVNYATNEMLKLCKMSERSQITEENKCLKTEKWWTNDWLHTTENGKSVRVN